MGVLRVDAVVVGSIMDQLVVPAGVHRPAHVVLGAAVALDVDPPESGGSWGEGLGTKAIQGHRGQ